MGCSISCSLFDPPPLFLTFGIRSHNNGIVHYLGDFVYFGIAASNFQLCQYLSVPVAPAKRKVLVLACHFRVKN